MSMTRKDFLRTASMLAASAPAVLSQNKKPNIVFILTDDHRYDLFGAAGHPWMKGRTPHTDRLVHEGVHFKNAFVTHSLCSPSRASILTGVYSYQHGVLDNQTQLDPKLLTFPKVLQEQGYRTAFVGKWHMGGERDDPRPGFHHWVSFRGQGVYFDSLLNINGTRQKVKGYITDILTEEARKFIRQNASRPFFLYLSHKAIHDPFQPAPRHEGVFRNLPIPYPKTYANTEENYRGKPEWVRKQRNSWHGVDGLYNKRDTFEEFYRRYCESYLAVDESIGAVLDELENHGLLNDTIVMYMADNGFLCGEHGLIDKRCMYEPSIRVPLMVRCPNLFPGGRKVEEMVLNVDIMPTVLDIVGVPVPGHVHGRSFLPLLRGEKVDWRKEWLYVYFWERDFPQTPTVLGLRTDRYSFMQYHGIWDINELYDIQSDPDQTNNLLGDVRITTQAGRLFRHIKDPALRELVGDLQNRMWKLLEQTGGRREPTWRRCPC